MMAGAEKVEFPIQPKLGAGLRTFFYSQFFVTPPYPTTSFAGQTIIITGANSGLGLEAARHFYRLNAGKLILAVRNVAKGQAAKEDIVGSVKRTDPEAIEIWTLDQASNQSTIDFSERVNKELPRLDAVILNAGINTSAFQMVDGFESATQVNVLNTFLLAFSLLPKLRDTKSKYSESSPHLTIVSSEAHRLTSFPEINAPNLYDKLNEKAAYDQQPRYQATKLMEVLLTREMVVRLKNNPAFIQNPVTINIVNPGLCTSGLVTGRNSLPLIARLISRVIERRTEVGGRCLVLGAAAPISSHGEFQSDGKNQDVEPWIRTEMGAKVQRKVWEQTVAILENRKPGVLKAAGL